VGEQTGMGVGGYDYGCSGVKKKTKKWGGG